jgi:hypothetical protein
MSACNVRVLDSSNIFSATVVRPKQCRGSNAIQLSCGLYGSVSGESVVCLVATLGKQLDAKPKLEVNLFNQSTRFPGQKVDFYQ